MSLQQGAELGTTSGSLEMQGKGAAPSAKMQGRGGVRLPNTRRGEPFEFIGIKPSYVHLCVHGF